MNLRLAVVVLIALGACSREPARISVGAAASLRAAMPELVERYRVASGVHVDLAYAASDELAAQIERGVAHDAIVLAEDAAVDRLIEAGRVTAGSRRELATNAIVLIGAPGTTATFAGLATLPVGAAIAIGDPAAVPAGRYARAYLQSIGVWDTIAPRLVLGGDVAGVVALAVSGRVAVAVVYRTDVASAAPLVVLDAPADAPVVRIVGGVVASSTRATAADGFLQFIGAQEGQAILARHGFAPPRSARSDRGPDPARP